ncbi:MAG: 50S ribosomal protein L32 [Planctomycetota bacterium]
MGVPRKRHSHSRVRTRRSHHSIDTVHLCDPEPQQAAERRMPHTICLKSGVYAAGRRRARRIFQVPDDQED